MALAPLIVRLAELDRGTVKRRFEPDEAERKVLAKTLSVDALEALTGEVTVTSWLDGAQLDGRFDARVVQTCGVTLDPFETALSGDFSVRLLPAGSSNLPANDEGEEITLDTPDPPEVLEGDAIDTAAYLVEHLALEIDPFPRKPGAVFEPPAPETEISPFAVLKKLKPEG